MQIHSDFNASLQPKNTKNTDKSLRWLENCPSAFTPKDNPSHSSLSLGLYSEIVLPYCCKIILKFQNTAPGTYVRERERKRDAAEKLQPTACVRKLLSRKQLGSFTHNVVSVTEVVI